MEKQGWNSAALTDIGTVRKVNEDNYLNAPELAIWCVADGMGGHQKGDVASQMIVEQLNLLNTASAYPVAISTIESCLQRVNTQLVELALTMPEPSVVGSTVATLVFDSSNAHCIWAGDSRIYRLRHRQLTRLTRDHSQVEEMLEEGLISEKEAETHPASNVITRAIGANDDLCLDVVSHPLLVDDIFLLCSDGLNKVMSDSEISASMQACPIDILPKVLIDKAIQRQARDNVTVVVVKYIGATARSAAQSGTPHLDDTLPLSR